MERIAFLGQGAMGTRMAARLLAAGHPLSVWNRTAQACAPLEAQGAKVAATPAQAAAGADIVIAMVRDDAASQAVWLGPEGALAAMPGNAVGIGCSTLSHPHVHALDAAFRGAGRGFVDAPLAGSRPQAEAGQLVFLCGGEAATLDRVRPVLMRMGTSVHHAGAAGAGTVLKLMVNALFGSQLASLGELLGFARAAGLDPALAVAIMAQTPVMSPAATLAAQAMLGSAFAPAFPIDLVEKDFGLLSKSGRHAGAHLPVARAVHAVYGAACAEGYAQDNITGVVQRYLPSRAALQGQS